MKVLLFFWAQAIVSGQADDPSKGFVQTRGRTRHFHEPGALKRTFLDNLPAEEASLVKFVLDFTNRCRWEAVVFFVSNFSDFSKPLALALMNYFNSEGKFVSIHATSQPLLPRSLQHNRHHLGVIYLCDVIDEDFLGKVSELDFFDSYRSWLIVERDNSTNKLEGVLKNLNLGLVTNVVVAGLERKGAGTGAANPSPSGTPVEKFPVGQGRCEGDSCGGRAERNAMGEANLVVHLVQVYKASATWNETVSVELGRWDGPKGLLKAKPLIEGERRWNLGGFKISVGVKNSSQELGGNFALDRFSFESEIDEESHFLELSNCLLHGLNASLEVVQFQKLGWRNEEGGWTHLLGAVVDGTVDFALETINPNMDKSRDMSFTYAIIVSMNNIYFRRPKAGGLRDIFLAPFGPRLLLCVLTTTLLLGIAMIWISTASYRRSGEGGEKGRNSEFEIVTRGRRERSVVWSRDQQRKCDVSEAALWSVSILCMQGSPWSPKSISGSLLLINSLLFALIIYNSFAAFITSVLSVKDIKIKDLKDLAASDFGFGYTLGDADELFLRTVNDTLLRELYFKGLRENEGVSNAIAGMQRAAKGNYAFFIKARTARRALRTVMAHDKRCEFQELYLPVTKTYASIPVTRKSSLRKILNFKIIRLMETGILHRFQRLILPSMPRCVEKTAFNSARITDVYSAFFLLAVGQLSSLVILFLEILWNKKTNMKARILNENYKLTSFRTGDGFYWLR